MSAGPGEDCNVRRLHPEYQRPHLEQIIAHLKGGAGHVGLFYGTGAGKSTMALALGARVLAMGLYTHVIIAAPTRIIGAGFHLADDEWIEDGSGRYPIPEVKHVRLRSVEELRRYLVQDNTTRTVVVTTHAAIRTVMFEKIAERAAPARVLLIHDEGHHSRVSKNGKPNLNCRVRDGWIARGGPVCSMTAVPWPDDGTSVFPRNVPFVSRSLTEQMIQHFAPSTLMNELVCEVIKRSN